jgi:hypothetical protein
MVRFGCVIKGRRSQSRVLHGEYTQGIVKPLEHKFLEDFCILQSQLREENLDSWGREDSR